MLSFLKFFKKKQPTPAIVEGEYLWCIVGNIVDKRYFGEEKEIKRGTKHFRPGAKVYCIPGHMGAWHDRIGVIGQPRKSKEQITIVMETRFIKNFRLQKIYSPTLFDKISKQDIYRISLSHSLNRERLEDLMRIYSNLTEEIED